MKAGGFRSVEDILIQALTSFFAEHPSPEPIARTGAELVAAMQSSPYKDIEIEPARTRDSSDYDKIRFLSGRPTFARIADHPVGTATISSRLYRFQ
jgi:hypothetical protein